MGTTNIDGLQERQSRAPVGTLDYSSEETKGTLCMDRDRTGHKNIVKVSLDKFQLPVAMVREETTRFLVTG